MRATKDKQVQILLILIFLINELFNYKKKDGRWSKERLNNVHSQSSLPKQRVTFDKLCEFMADGSTVSQADVAAVFTNSELY